MANSINSLRQVRSAPGAKENYEFSTSIITARDGSEQRRMMRLKPRQSISYEVPVNDTNAREIECVIRKAIGYGDLIPLWHRSTTTLISTFPGAILTNEPMPVDFQIGSIVLIAGVAYEVLTVTDRKQFSVLPTDWPSGGYPSGSTVVPAWECALSDSQSESLTSQMTGRIAIDAERVMSPDYELSRWASTFPQPPIVIDGMEVLLARPSWASDRSIELSWLRSDLDYGIGVKTYKRLAEASRATRSFGYVMSDDAIDNLIAFFIRQFGRQKRFICPSWDVEVRANTFAGDMMSMTIVGSSFGESANQVNAGYLMTSHPATNELSITKLASVTSDTINNLTTLTFSAPWALEYSPLQSSRTSFCSTVRFATDSISATFDRKGLASLELSTHEVDK